MRKYNEASDKASAAGYFEAISGFISSPYRDQISVQQLENYQRHLLSVLTAGTTLRKAKKRPTAPG